MSLSKKENLARRAEIGAERRARLRLQILQASIGIFGNEAGRGVRLQDICEAAGIARGTFYNHFTSLDEFAQVLCDEITRGLDRSVNAAFPQFDTAAERNAAALRYYLHAADQNPDWGWALLNTVKGPTFFGPSVYENAALVIQTGIDSGDFDLENAGIGRDILLGAAHTALQRLLSGTADDGYVELIACRVLRAFGMSRDDAFKAANRPLPALPEIADAEPLIVPVPRLRLNGSC